MGNYKRRGLTFFILGLIIVLVFIYKLKEFGGILFFLEELAQ